MANNANILLHGLFFLQYQGDKLIVMTPDHPHHHQFLFRQQGQQGTDIGSSPKPFPTLPQDLDFTYLIGDKVTMQPFPSAMLRFSTSTTGVGDLMVKSGPNYKCRIVLNWPLGIMVLRSSGKLKDYHSNQKKVGQNIASNSGPDLGLVTLLHYETTGLPFTVSLFAEHRVPPQVTDMNPALTNAQGLFSNGANFDLQLVECNCEIPCVCPDDALPSQAQIWGVDRDDEHSFGEIYDSQDCACSAGTDVANCVQYGLLP